MAKTTPADEPSLQSGSLTGSKEVHAVLYTHDAKLRVRLETLLMDIGYETDSCASVEALRGCLDEPQPVDCVVLGEWHFEREGQDWLRQTAATRLAHAVVFVGGGGDARQALEAMAVGDARFVSQDASDQEIRSAISSAVTDTHEQRSNEISRQVARARLAWLTVRERQVCNLLARGRLNKQVAAELGISEKTVKFYRARLQAKLGVRSVADLVRLVDCAASTQKR